MYAIAVKIPFSATQPRMGPIPAVDPPVASRSTVMNESDRTWPTITVTMLPILRPAMAPVKSASPHPSAAARPKIT